MAQVNSDRISVVAVPRYEDAANDKRLEPEEPEPAYTPPAKTAILPPPCRSVRAPAYDIENQARGAERPGPLSTCFGRFRTFLGGSRIFWAIYLILFIGSIIWLGSYLHRKSLRPPNWSATNTDYEAPPLIGLLVIVGLGITSILTAFYWQTLERILILVDWLSEQEGFCPLLAALLMIGWMLGFLACGAPPFVLASSVVWG